MSRPLSTASTVTLHTPAVPSRVMSVDLESNSKTESKRTACSNASVSLLPVLPSVCEMFRRCEKLFLTNGAAIQLQFLAVHGTSVAFRYCCSSESSNRQLVVTVASVTS